MCPEWNYQRFSDVFFAPFGLTVHFAHPLSTVVATAMLMDAGLVTRDRAWRCEASLPETLEIATK